MEKKEKKEKIVKTVVESDHDTFRPVGQDERCAFCSAGCKTTCVRLNEAVHVEDKEVEKH